jgi:hypothetical protein
MEDELLLIQKRLDELAAKREAERIAANKEAAEKLAAARMAEDARIAKGKEAERLTNERFAKLAKEKEDAQRAFLQREQETKLAIARKNDAKQSQLAREAQRQAAITKAQADLEFLEEQEKRRLEDALLPKGKADITPPHPLKRFLMHVPE